LVNSKVSVGSDPSKKIEELQKATIAWLAVVKAYNQCDALLEKQLAKLGVQVAEHEVLMNLSKVPGSTQQEIAKYCFSAKSGISMLITKLENDGLVVRRPDAVDARVKRVSLTAKGNRLAAKTLQVQIAVVQAMTSEISESELETIHRTMVLASVELEAMLKA
jgi:DNA-binding MarR family transcriptional regulator